MNFLQLISLLSWSVACSSIIQGENHVFYANVTTPANVSTTTSASTNINIPTNTNTNANVNVNTNPNTNANTDANIPFQNVTDFDPFKSRAAAVQNLQSFNGALAGVQAPPILMSSDKSRPFLVQGDTFPDFPSAGGRSCDRQYVGCSEAANAKNNMAERGPKGGKEGGSKSSKRAKGQGPKNDNRNKARIRAIEDFKNNPSARVPQEEADAAAATGLEKRQNDAGPNKGDISVADCNAQKTACNTAQKNAPFQSFNLENVGPDPAMPDFDLLCAP